MICISILKMPPNINCLEANLNERVAIPLTQAVRNISAGCVAGRNHVTLHNHTNESIQVTIEVDIKAALSIKQLVERLPWDVDSLLDLSSLSFSTSRPQEDVHVVHTQSSRTCPISLMAMEFPAKGRDCKHSQLFDAASFLRLASFTDSWKCPICKYAPIPIIIPKLTQSNCLHCCPSAITQAEDLVRMRI